MKKRRCFRRMLACAAGLALCAGCGPQLQPGQPEVEPVQITVWNYYNGEQLDRFNDLVARFNETVGKEQHISVESASQGSVDDLETNVLNAAAGKVGYGELPNIFSAYADTAYALDQMGILVDLSPYFSEEERDAFVPAYLEEGDFDGSGSIKIFPVAKSTELMFLNDTDWQIFAAETGVTYDDLSTVEGLLNVADLYYDWTDAQTPELDDGRAFFGRDAMANYLIVGAKELGMTMLDVDGDGKLTLHFDRDVVRRLWDSYYIPFIRGRFCATGRFRSDDIKTGNLLAYVGSSSSATFFPEKVTHSDTESHAITCRVLRGPHFSGHSTVVAQQGAGMAVANAPQEEVEASVVFLKWFAEAKNNIAFAVGASYLPVTKAANHMDAVRESGLTLTPQVESVLATAMELVNEDCLYTSRAFETGREVREILEYALSDRAAADRATVEERMAQGQRLTDAAAEFLTDSYFDAWYTETLGQLQALEG